MSYIRHMIAAEGSFRYRIRVHTVSFSLPSFPRLLPFSTPFYRAYDYAENSHGHALVVELGG